MQRNIFFHKTFLNIVVSFMVVLTLPSCAKKPSPDASKTSAGASPMITKQSTSISGPTVQPNSMAHHDSQAGKKPDPTNESTHLISMDVVTQTFNKQDYIIVAVKPEDYQKLSILSVDDQQKPLHQFSKLQHYIQTQDQEKLVFAMNAGMFEADFKPTGLLIQNGQQINPINKNTEGKTGNFYLKENAVFLMDQDLQAKIIKRDDITDEDIANALWATQSGPMLVVDGKSREYETDAGKTNAVIRNAIATCTQGDQDLIIMALSKQPVTFPEFSDLFIKHFNCQRALYLDGDLSQAVYAGQVAKNDQQHYSGFIVITERALEFEDTPTQ